LSDWIGWLLAVPTKKPVDKWTSLGGARQKPKAGNRDECDQLLWASAEHKLFLREEPNFFWRYAFIWATGISLVGRHFFGRQTLNSYSLDASAPWLRQCMQPAT
jgi:hypothetical protein